MLPYFKQIVLIILCCSIFYSFSADKKDYNPIWVDSILKNKTDSAQMLQLKQSIFIDGQKATPTTVIIQPLRAQQKALDYMYAALLILLIIALLYVFFGDYFLAVRESLVSIKQYQVYLAANKFDNFFLIVALFLFKIILLAFVVNSFINIYVSIYYNIFNYKQFAYILSVIAIFFSLKMILEIIVLFVIGQIKTYRLFYFNKLFFDIAFACMVALIIVLMYYNTSTDIRAFLILFGAIYTLYIVYKGFKITQFAKISNKIYFILYLCTFKIMPLMLVVKYFWLNLK
ncbi:MAG: DUF4271 domain-containing protein [Bacteroidetes bacterium]|nr:DUF4271 domain-containing protein [Bacteroidota bacterium]